MQPQNISGMPARKAAVGESATRVFLIKITVLNAMVNNDNVLPMATVKQNLITRKCSWPTKILYC